MPYTTQVIDETPEGKFLSQKQMPTTQYDESSSLNNYTTDLEYKATKKLNRENKNNLDTLLKMRLADDKFAFFNHLNSIIVRR